MAEARRRWFCRWRRLGPVEPQHEVSTARPISAGGGLNDIHPMRRGGVKSFVDDLVLGRGVVISRAATSLRSVETQPLTRRFVRTRRATISVPSRRRLNSSHDGDVAMPPRLFLPLSDAGSNPAPGYQHIRDKAYFWQWVLNSPGDPPLSDWKSAASPSSIERTKRDRQWHGTTCRLMRLFLFFLFQVLHYISLFVIRSDFENFQSPKKNVSKFHRASASSPIRPALFCGIAVLWPQVIERSPVPPRMRSGESLV